MELLNDYIYYFLIPIIFTIRNDVVVLLRSYRILYTSVSQYFFFFLYISHPFVDLQKSDAPLSPSRNQLKIRSYF